GSDQTSSTCRLEDFPFLFGGADDLEFLEDVELSRVVDGLARAFAKEHALQLALILLDSWFSFRARRTASEELEVRLHSDEVESFVEGVLYAHVLPIGTDLTGALACIPGDARRTRKLLGNLGTNQSHIAAVQHAWEAIPTSLFGGEAERRQTRAAAIRAG